MKISIITPSHDARFLNELKESILANTHSAWEWIVLLNNGADYESDDPRIRVIHSEINSTAVGALKKEACSYATGDVIAEVDHDDLITPDCLGELAAAFADTAVGFVYSDNAVMGSFTPYDPTWGWTYKKFSWRGEELVSMNSQPIYPGRLSYIWFAPDHIRAWRRSVYEFIGGHDNTLDVCDDQDLILRTYLATKFHHINKVLYIYRVTGDNTYLKRNATIQERTVQLYDRYIYAVSERFAELNNLLKVDLCGGHNSPPGYLSIDKYNATVLADLEKGIPLADNSVGVLRAHDAIEHLRDKIFTMKEIHRVLAPGGILLSMTPSTDGRGAWQDPTHVSFWNENSFWYWTRAEQMQYIRNTDNRFRECRLTTLFPSEWHRQHNIPYVVAHLEKLT